MILCEDVLRRAFSRLGLPLLLCAIGLFSFQRPLSADQYNDQVVQEIQYGKLLSQKILSRYPLLRNKEVTLYVNRVGKSVALFAGRPELNYHFAILDTDAVNAFAAPGGYIYVTRGAIKLMQNEAELAAVLAHEIGHVNNRHIMKQLPPPRESGGISFLTAFLVSQGAVVSAAFTEVVGKAESLLFEEGYLIADEFEADESALDYLNVTGYDVASLETFLNRTEQYKTGHSAALVYNTHPPVNERTARIKAHIAKMPPGGTNAKAADRFGRYKNLL